MKGLLDHALQRGIARSYVARLLRAFGDAAELHTEAGSLRESLSDRERDVLRLLALGRSGPEIADVLVVAPSTIKTHLKSIYAKLDVHSRHQAIVRARELDLV
jgi:LuxR family maltose regulon positive regulatory protein